ncbi:hypothetical protein ACWF62_15005 [Rhodococcus sp. NPDC054953]
MDPDEPLLTTLADAMPPLPDDVWERVLSVALDPTTEAVDPDLVPEMDDTPVIPDDDGEIILDDADDSLAADDDAAVDLDDANDAINAGDSDDLDLPVDHGDSLAPDLSVDAVDLTTDDGFDGGAGPDIGGDLY